jgi:predicted metal-dependent phosphoesterase TrpH
MLNYMRNKLMSVARVNEYRLNVYGVLDDDLYGLWVKVGVSLPELKIVAVEAGWNRWTTPECWRAIEPLQEAVGMLIEPGLRQEVQKSIGRKGCRHFANLLLECCHAAREAADWIKEKNQERKGAEDPASGDVKQAVSLVPSGIHEEGVGKKPKDGKPKRNTLSRGTIIDLHVHTSVGSPCSKALVEDLIEEAKRVGLSGICLTDHNYVWSLERVEDLRQKHAFLILRGNEITTDQGDILVFGLDKEITGIIKLEALRKEVMKAGGMMIAAHPFRGFLVFDAAELGLTPEKAMERRIFKCVDAVEVMNSKVTKEENDFAAKVAGGLGMPGTGGSDAHEVGEVGLYATSFPGVIRDERELMEALRRGEGFPMAFRRRCNFSS